jgi:hypothetical protein
MLLRCRDKYITNIPALRQQAFLNSLYVSAKLSKKNEKNLRRWKIVRNFALAKCA